MFVRRAAASGEGPTDDEGEPHKENEVEAADAEEAEDEEQRPKQVHWKVALRSYLLYMNNNNIYSINIIEYKNY
jgi:hypothetical protein